MPSSESVLTVFNFYFLIFNFYLIFKKYSFNTNYEIRIINSLRAIILHHDDSFRA